NNNKLKTNQKKTKKKYIKVINLYISSNNYKNKMGDFIKNIQFQKQKYFSTSGNQHIFDLGNSDQYSSSTSSEQPYFNNLNQDFQYYLRDNKNNYHYQQGEVQMNKQENNCPTLSNFPDSSYVANKNIQDGNKESLFNLFQYQIIEDSTQQQQFPNSQCELDSAQKSAMSNEQFAIVPRKQNIQFGIIDKPIKKQYKKLKNSEKNCQESDEKDEEQNNNQLQGISSKYNCNAIKQNTVGNFNYSKKKKKFGIINILKNIVIDKSFLLPGQIIINTQFDQGYKNVYINSDIYQAAKRVEKVVYNKERNTFESHFQTINAGLNDFEFIIKLLESKSDQQIYQQAQILRQYQQFISTYQNAFRAVQQMGIFDQELFQQNTERFIQQAEEVISKQPKDSIYIYFLNRINYAKGIYEEIKFGFNKGVCAIIGIEEEEAIQFSNQMLILCMMTPESQFQYYTSILQAEMQGQTNINIDYQQYTFEGMEIKLSTKQTIHHFPGQISQKDFSLRILEIEPDLQTLQKIIKGRNEPNKAESEFLAESSFNKKQLNRYQAGLKFLEDFYQSKVKKQNKPLRCDFVVKQALPICQAEEKIQNYQVKEDNK
ncbi:hypothetical protein TTHERM_00841180, partial (macronuclear) [Tetrahymena thermophila SB210]